VDGELAGSDVVRVVAGLTGRRGCACLQRCYIRLLLAKDAVTTGWDCPRAEVLYSLRPARDRTYITQLLGRMIRTPLARRVESDERLNSVWCYLPKFDKKTAVDVANRLTGRTRDDEGKDTGAPGGGQKVLFRPVALTRNPFIPEEVWELLADLPSEGKPNPLAKPISRLLALAVALSGDELVANASAIAHDHMFRVIDGIAAENSEQVNQGIDEIKTADIRTLTVTLAGEFVGEEGTTTPADTRTIDDAFRLATRLLGRSVALGYTKRLAVSNSKPEGELDIYAAKARTTAIMRMPAALAVVEERANLLAKEWLTTYNVAIKHLPEARRSEYKEIEASSREPYRRSIDIPTRREEDTVDDAMDPLELVDRHLLSDAEGTCPIPKSSNDWERKVIKTELGRENVVAWYRNPSSATDSALCIPYRDEKNIWRSHQPDFLFISRRADGALAASVVDPHDPERGGLVRLIGQVDFLDRYGDEFLRFESLAEVGGRLMVLDLTDPTTRSEVRQAKSAARLFAGTLAYEYR
jgi:type III restriction enzyme